MDTKYHILVADDESSVREVLRDLILAIGDDYVVYTAADSYEALHMLHSMPLDLALIDIFMPGLNGFELLKEARRKYPQVIMVVITGQPSYKMVLEALRLGAADFLSKPISLAELRKILTKLKEESFRPENQSVPSPLNIQGNSGTLTQERHDNIRGQDFLHSISERLGAIRHAGDLYSFLTNMSLTITGGILSAFYLYDQELGRLQLVSQAEKDPGNNGDSHVVPQTVLPTPCSRYLKADPQSKQLISPACVSLPLKLRNELLGVLHVYPPAGEHFDIEVLGRLQLLVDRSLLTLENLTLHESVFSYLYDTLTTLINSLEARDPYSRHHSVRVTHIASHFAEKLNLSSELVDSLRLAGPLHDIGKIGIPDAILLKPNKLTPSEAQIIRQHPVIGDNIVTPLNLSPRERAIILHHHERWDGRGYPKGLAGEEIPLLSRIIALADSFDAITSDRPYRQRRTHEEALAEIAFNANAQFDPDLANHFLEIMSQPKVAEDMFGATAELQTGQPPLSDLQFLQLKESFNHKLIHLNGLKKFPIAFPQLTAVRSDI